MVKIINNEKREEEGFNQKGIDYSSYDFTKVEWLKHIGLGGIFFFGMGMVFFNHVILAIIACGLLFFYIKEKREEAARKRRAILLEQFKEGMYTLTSALSAGRSIEQAFYVSLKDLQLIYRDEDDIIIEWEYICYKLSMNVTVELAMYDLATRSGLEEIRNFNDVFLIAKRSGGNLVEIMKETCRLINEKIEIQKEIDVLVISKQYEQRILSFIIPGMIVFFGAVSPNFLEPLYTTLMGRGIMILALCMYLVAGKIGKRIVAIEV